MTTALARLAAFVNLALVLAACGGPLDEYEDRILSRFDRLVSLTNQLEPTVLLNEGFEAQAQDLVSAAGDLRTALGTVPTDLALKRGCDPGLERRVEAIADEILERSADLEAAYAELERKYRHATRHLEMQRLGRYAGVGLYSDTKRIFVFDRSEGRVEGFAGLKDFDRQAWADGILEVFSKGCRWLKGEASDVERAP